MKTLVNVITIIRLTFAIVLFFLFGSISNAWFLSIAIVLFLTDFIDGFLARKYHVETLFGSIFDALADKMLCVLFLIPLLAKCKYLYFVLGGEVLILLVNTIGRLTGKNPKTIYFGKVKMWILSVTIILGYVYYFYNYAYSILIILSGITFAIQIWTVVKYIIFLCKQKGKTIILQKEKLLYQLFDTEYYLKYLEK